MRAKQVVVELVSSRIDVVLFVGGKRVDAVRVQVDLPGEAREWVEEVTRAADAVKSAVEKLGAAGAKATVLYQSPTQALDFSSFPVKAAEALEAAELECLDALPYSGNRALFRCLLLGRDRGGDPRQHHVLATAEREDVSCAIVDFVNKAGLTFSCAVPLNALTLAGLVQKMLSTSGPVRGHLHVGEQGSFFLVADGGVLLFARQIRIGIESMVTALTRPIHRGGGGQLTELDADAARRILYEHGRPKPDVVVDEASGLKGHELSPLVQPVLQRLVIEIRQSLRFGMKSEHRDSLVITFGGPGATIPGFAKLLSTELGVTVEPAKDTQPYDVTIPAGDGGELIAAARRTALHGRLNLQPRAITIRRNTDRLRRWLWTGGALAMAVIGFDAVQTNAQAAKLQADVDAVAREAAGHDSLVTNGRLVAVVGALNRAEERIREEIPGRANFGAVVREFAQRTPESIELLTFGLLRDGDEATNGRVSGFAFGVEGRTELESYMQTLAECPLLEDVKLGDVQIGRMGNEYGEQFSASISLVLTPPVEFKPALASAEEDAP